MNILHLESSPGWGGQEMRILSESKGMRKRGYKIFFAIQKGAKSIPRVQQENFKVYKMLYKKAFWFFSFFYLIWIIKKNNIKIINTHSSNDAWLGGFIGRLLKIPVIRTRHLSTSIKTGLNSYLLYNALANYVVTTCKAIVPTIIKQSKKEKKYCFSVPTGVDINAISVKKQERSPLFFDKIKKTDFLIGTACFMRSWKGIEQLLCAATFLRNQKDIKWAIIGGGNSKKYIKKAKELNLEDIVIFTGHLENPFAAINALNVFAILSTDHEGVSQASLQAAYLKKPIIGTSVGGIPEVCLNNKTGIIVPPFSASKVAEAVMSLKKDVNLRKTMGKNAKELVLKTFSHEKMLDQMENIYKKIM